MMRCLRLWLEQSSSYWHFIVICLIILAVSFFHPVIFIALIIYLIYIFRVIRLTKLLVIIMISYVFLFGIRMYSFYNQKENITKSGIVINCNRNKYTIKTIFNKYEILTDEALSPGDYIKFTGKIIKYNKEGYEGDFSEEKYYLGLGVNGKYEATYIKKINSFLTPAKIKFNLLNYYEEKLPAEIFKLFSALIFGENILTSDEKIDFGRLNILHILALSGLHVQLVYSALKKIFFSITKKYYFTEKISLFFVFTYCLICGFSNSLLRAFLFLFISKINENIKVFTKLDIYSLCFLLVILNPTKIYNIGFILGQLASFLILYMPRLCTTKNIIIRNIIQGILFLSITFPFVTNFNNSYTVIALFSFLFADFFLYFWIPCCFLMLIIPKIGILINPIYNSFIALINNFGNTGLIYFPYMDWYLKIIYYLILTLIYIAIIRKKRRNLIGIFMFLFMTIFINKNIFIFDEVCFVSVGQGDCTYFQSGKNNFLVDCYNGYDYLVKRGIRHLNAIFITHSDKDHVGDLEKICKEIKVDVIYINKFDEETLNLEIKNIQRIGIGKNIIIGSFYIQVLSPIINLNDDNANSLVLLIKNAYYDFLLMGDATISTEKILLQYELIKKVDFLKVGHHGSNTSTSSQLIEKTKPDYAIISVGKNNYNLPNNEVVFLLKQNAKVFLTSTVGTIKINKKIISSYHS